MAYLFQSTRHKQQRGDKAPWSVGWYDPDGKKRSRKIGSRSMAEKFARKVEGQIAAGTYDVNTKMTWAAFRKQYEETILSTRRPRTQQQTRYALDHFERIIKPTKLAAIKTATIERYIAKRQKECSGLGKRPVAPATVNKELRMIRAALRRAVRWELISKAPVFDMLKEDRPHPKVMPDEDFAALLEHTSAAMYPDKGPIPAADWWRALLIFARFTGWRRNEVLELQWEDVDLEPDASGLCWAVCRGESSKGGHTDRVPLTPIVAASLQAVRTLKSPLVFPWPTDERRLYADLDRIARAAGVTFPVNGRRTDKFHALRKTYGTRAAMAGIDQKSLMALMRHKSWSTTERYYLDAEALTAKAVEKVDVGPAVLRVVG